MNLGLASRDHASVAIYARTSSPNQRFNYSTNEQVNESWRYAEGRAWLVKYVFVDECHGGGTIERPMFQMMMKRAEAHEFNVIIFWKLDRFCRSLVDLVNLQKKFQVWGIDLCSVSEFFDTTTPVGRFNYRTLASVAELEREQIGERARLGLHGLARARKWPNPHPPLGYAKDSEGRLVIVPNEAELVKRVFTMYLEVESTPEVAFRLNTQGIMTRKGSWTARAVRDILTNSLYVGLYHVAGVQENVEEYRIVSDEALKKVGHALARYKSGVASRLQVPTDRKSASIEKIYGRYTEFIQHQLMPSLQQR